MSLQKLIDNQTIMIDDHHWGAGEIKDWNDSTKDIHIDKKTQYKIDGKIQEVRIRLPINSNIKIKITTKSEKFLEVPRKLNREIKRAFEDRLIRDSFIQDLILTLENYSSNFDSLDNTKDALKRISNQFGLNWTDNELVTKIGDAIDEVEAIPTDSNNKKYYISINRKRIQIGDIDSELKKELIKKGFEL
ncbi:MAG TPA: hypothetical protein ENK66_07950 [Arcobacter sp.]|nr:hypothetical protein [Arcobacter sp.]